MYDVCFAYHKHIDNHSCRQNKHVDRQSKQAYCPALFHSLTLQLSKDKYRNNALLNNKILITYEINLYGVRYQKKEDYQRAIRQRV